MSSPSPHSFCIPILLLLLCALCGVGIAESSDISQISITSITLTPEIYAPGDKGTVELTIQNKGDSSVQLEVVSMTGNEVRVTSLSHTLASYIGIRESRSYSFDIIAPMEPGIYYPYISVNTVNAGFAKYSVPIRVDSTKPFITIAQSPSSLIANRETTMQIQVANSRPDTIRNVQVIPSIQGEPAVKTMEIIPNQYFIGTLETGEVRAVLFSITPTIETDLTFTLSYQTGDNVHESEITFPILFSADKKQAEMALSSVSFSTINGVQQVTGDITNIGLETAYSVTATISGAANPVFPYKDYVLGTLDPDDFANFQLTFELREQASTATIIVTFKDGDANQHITALPIELGGHVYDMSSSFGNDGGGPAPLGGSRLSGGNEGVTQIPADSLSYLAVAIIILIIGGGVYLFYQREKAHKKGKRMERKDENLMKEIESYEAEDASKESPTLDTSDEKL